MALVFDDDLGDDDAARDLSTGRARRAGHGARALRVPRPVSPGTAREASPFVPMRTRTHGGIAARTTVVGSVVRPMVRSTIGIEAGPPPLRVVVPLRRRTARLVAIGFAVIFVLMLGAAAFETQLAKRQVKLDKIDRDISTATDSYNRLRRERAELQSPERLATEATKLGMQPSNSTDFVSIDPSIIAEVQRSAGGVFDANATVLSPLDEFTRVKSIVGTGP
jgi:cell division protein FtsL